MALAKWRRNNNSPDVKTPIHSNTWSIVRFLTHPLEREFRGDLQVTTLIGCGELTIQ